MQLSVRATYGPDKLEVLGLDAPLARKYLGAREQCLETVDRMRRPGLVEQLGDTRAGHSHLALDDLADGMEADVRRFEKLYDELADMKKILHLSMVAKDEAQDDLRRKYTNVARMQEGMFRIVGLDELADRIRITIPSPPTQGDEEEQADAQEADAPHGGEDAARESSTGA